MRPGLDGAAHRPASGPVGRGVRSRPLECAMSRSPGPVGAATTTLHVSAEEHVSARVGGWLEAVFDAVAQTRADTAALLARGAAEGRRPAPLDPAAPRPGLHLRLAPGEPGSRGGFVAPPRRLPGGAGRA